MTRIYCVVEGQTEETFINELLAPHYVHMGLYITPIIVSTSRGYKGGITTYAKVKPQLQRLCRQDHNAKVSTLFDLYALPNDFPGKAHADYPAQGTGEQKANFIEAHLSQDINEINFIPNLMVHEFEALLFVQPEKFSEWVDNAMKVNRLKAISDLFKNPENINEKPHLAPSKRILEIMPNYQKTLHGPLITMEIGLDAIRQTCPHFNAWLSKLDMCLI